MQKRKWTDEEVDEFRKAHGAFFYFNKEDSNFLVPKAKHFGLGAGWTFNWANPITWVFIAVILGLIFWKNMSK